MKTAMQAISARGRCQSLGILLIATLTFFGQPSVTGQSWPQISFANPIGGFQHPTHLTTANDGSGRVFVTEQSGVIRIVKDGAVMATPFLNISDRTGKQGSQGLFSVAFPPNYASQHHFYVNYVTSSAVLVIARYQVTADPNVADPNSEQIVLSVGPFQNGSDHFGGELAFGPDGYLYFGTGTGSGASPDNLGHDLTVLFGKLLRIDVETGNPVTYTIPPTNPFLTNPNARPEIWAVGLRNPWSSSFDRLTGDFYIADVGQSEREEVDFQPANSPGGADYGWDIMEGSLCFNGTTCDTTGLTLPVTEYDHTQGCDISGGVVYRSAPYPDFQGIYFYGDWCSGNIWGLQQTNGSWESSLLSTSTLSVISFGQDEAGLLWVADYNGGAIYSITDNPPTPVNLSVTQTESADPSAVNNPLTYTIQVKNNSSATATGIVLSDTWTTGVPFVSVASDQGSCSRSGNTSTCRIPSLASGTTATISLTLKPSAVGTVNNSASAISNEPDSDSADNSTSENTTIVLPPVQITVQTNLPGLSFSVDGTTYTSPKNFSWIPGSSHTIATNSPQNGGTGTRYVWSKWSDNKAISHMVAPTTNTTYTATFTTQYYLTMTAGSGGTVIPMSGWKNAGATVSIGATPTNNTSVSYNFNGWNGTGTGSYSGTANPTSITMSGPITEAATFTQQPVQVTVQTAPAGFAFTVDGVNYTSVQTFSWTPGSSHTIATTSPQNATTTTRSIWTKWSDNGAISHTISPKTNATYTATFTNQYYLTMTAGAGGTVTPARGWKNAGTVVQIGATPTNNTSVSYNFNAWTGSGSGSYSGTTNPTSITMNEPITEVASFTQNPVQVTVQTNFTGLVFSVDGVSYTSPQSFTWAPGSSHTIATNSPQSATTSARTIWTKWSDNGAISHTVSPTTNKAYTATFTNQYYLTMTAGSGGKVSPVSGWKNSGAVVSITATPNSGFVFSSWSGNGTGSFSGTTNPVNVTMGGPVSETAAFTTN